MNHATLIGRIGMSPEIKAVGDSQVCTVSLATNEVYTKDGQRIEKTEWHRIIAWNKLANTIGQYVQKGDLLGVEGKIQTRKWTDDKGVERYTTEIVANKVHFLTPKKSGTPGPTADDAPPTNNASAAPTEAAEDDLPF